MKGGLSRHQAAAQWASGFLSLELRVGRNFGSLCRSPAPRSERWDVGSDAWLPPRSAYVRWIIAPSRLTPTCHLTSHAGPGFLHYAAEIAHVHRSMA
ncbi:MAG: hypothetical protein JWP25_4842 [Bradyrhizobium sp.]|nr:hypothetical protein [Bradyrhizobium sp.]